MNYQANHAVRVQEVRIDCAMGQRAHSYLHSMRGRCYASRDAMEQEARMLSSRAGLPGAPVYIRFSVLRLKGLWTITSMEPGPSVTLDGETYATVWGQNEDLKLEPCSITQEEKKSLIRTYFPHRDSLLLFFMADGKGSCTWFLRDATEFKDWPDRWNMLIDGEVRRFLPRAHHFCNEYFAVYEET